MTKGLIHGVYAAALSPRDKHGDLDEAALARQLEFLLSSGIRNFALNGATGEYCSTSLSELKRSLHVAKIILPADANFLCGVGAGRLRDTLELGRAGMEAGAQGMLVPMPYFFPYAQNDLSAFVRAVATELPVPMLLYNLPQFTSGLEATTVITLIKECGNIIGIKDSSGSLEILRALTSEGIACSRIMGNDGVLAQALTAGICDGVVSGVACVLPEVIQPLFSNRTGSAPFRASTKRLKEFIARIDLLPAPWGLKAIAEARGIAAAVYPMSLSTERARQIRDLQEWFKEWILWTKEPEAIECV